MRKTVGAIILLAAASASLQAEAVIWDLDAAVRRAVERNLTLKLRKIDVQSRNEAVERSWNQLLPNLDAGLSLKRTESVDPPWSLSADLVAGLRVNASIRTQVDRARAAYEAGLVSYEQARQQVVRDVGKAFYQVLLYEQRIRLAEQSLELAEKQYQRTAALYEAGRASELDLLSARVTRENARPDVLALRNSTASLVAQLKYLTGLSPEDELDLTGEIALPAWTPDRERVLSEVNASSLAVKRLRGDLEALEISRRITVQDVKVPYVSLSYSYAPRVSGPIVDNFTETDNWTRKGTLTLAVSIPLDPLIPNSKDDASVRAADAGIAQKRLELEQALYTSRMDAANLLNQLAGITETLRARELAATQTEEAFARTTVAYERGASSLLEVQDAQTDMQRAQVAVLNETYNYLAALIDLEYALGTSLPKE